MKDAQGVEHWMLVEGGKDVRPDVPYASRFESLGLKLPETRLTTRELLDSAAHHPNIDLETLTGIRERRVCSDGEDSFTLAVAAARDCLAHSGHQPEDIELLISASISKYKGGLRQQLEPPMSLAIKREIGAHAAKSFDLGNACAGMLSSVFVLNDFIRRGDIRCGMAVSGEYISSLDRNAARQVRSVMSNQLASLTLGDAGVAVILERAPEGNPGITFAGFTTLAEHSRLCIGTPAKVGPGATMFTKARTIHRVAIEDAPPLLADALEETGLTLGDVDHVIVHQTSARAIRKAAREFTTRLGMAAKNFVDNVAERGNTASTTHFVALYEYLEAERFKKGDEILLLSLASGLEVGVVIFQMDELVDHYGHAH